MMNEEFFSSYNLYWGVLALIVALGFTVITIVFNKSALKNQLFAMSMLVILAVTFDIWAESFINHKYQQDARVDALQKLSVVRAKLETTLNNNLSIIKGLGIAIAANPKLGKTDFDNYAREIMRTETLLSNLAAAPDMVVKFVYPYVGNEKVIGLNYFRNEKQRAAALKVRDSRKVIVAGPVNLVQGGRALIGRSPIFYFDEQLKEEKFWGILSAPMLIDKVLNAAGALEFDKSHKIALRKKYNPENMIYGEITVFTDNPVIAEVSVAGELWELASQAEKSPQGLVEVTNYVRSIFMFFTLLIFVIIFIRSRQKVERTRFIEQLKYRENILQSVGSIASIGGWEYSTDQGFLFLSDEIYYILQIEKSGQILKSKQLLSVVNSDYLAEFEQAWSKLIETSVPLECDLPITLNDQTEKWIHIQGHVIESSNEKSLLQGVVQDITERKKTAKIIENQANYDPLTQLINRNLFDQQLALTVSDARKDGESFALLYIDLDRFKMINDSFGHSIGDKLLITVSQRFLSCVRDSDILSRRSGDEFTLIVKDIDNRESVEPIAKNILSQLKQSFFVDGNQINIGASIGITMFPEDGNSAEMLLKNADQGMYTAKAKGRNTFSYFTSDMQVVLDRRLKLHIDMIEALDNGFMDVYYQPIINMHTGFISECEALIRWEHPELGFIAAQELIDLAEDVGLISRIGNFVMERSIADISAINSNYGLDLGVAINKSYREFLTASSKIPLWIEELKENSNNLKVTVEITESLLIENDDIYQLLKELRSAGVKVALDDFGTGYSSLSYLRRFPVDQLKIDRSFVTDIDTNKEDLALVDIILAMANNLKLKVVAEGVENAAQLKLLKQRNCDFCQGYFIAKPMDKKQFEQWLQQKQHY